MRAGEFDSVVGGLMRRAGFDKATANEVTEWFFRCFRESLVIEFIDCFAWIFGLRGVGVSGFLVFG